MDSAMSLHKSIYNTFGKYLAYSQSNHVKFGTVCKIK